MSQATGRFVSLGDNCLDVYLEQDRVTVGGSALNVAAQWRAAGLDSAYVGAVGKDRPADLVRRGVQIAGLDPLHLRALDGRTGVTKIRLVAQEREFVAEDLGVGVDWAGEGIEADTAHAAWCHVTGTSPAAAIPRRLVQSGRRVSVDLLGRPNGGQGSLEGVEIAFTSSDGTRAEAEADARGLIDAGAHLAVVMRGSQGSLAIVDGTVHAVSADAITPVDTCGAGDSFIAAFIAAHASGSDPASTLTAATHAATATCLHLGGFPQEAIPIPDWLQ